MSVMLELVSPPVLSEFLVSRLCYIRQLYDSLVDSYVQVYGEESCRKYVHVLYIMSRLHVGRESLVIVDLGCGVGIGLLYVSACRFSKYVVGVDISGRSIRVAHQIFRKFSNVDLVQCIIEMLPFRNNCADMVLSVSTLDTQVSEARELQEEEALRVARRACIHVTVGREYEVYVHLKQQDRRKAYIAAIRGLT